MGYMSHHAIIVTSWSWPRICEAHRKAGEIFDTPRTPWSRPFIEVSPILTSLFNGYASFLVAPDGSKEGWPESDEGDRRRAAFVAWLGAQKESDGSSVLSWVEVRYGDDEGENAVVRDDGEYLRRMYREEIEKWEASEEASGERR